MPGGSVLLGVSLDAWAPANVKLSPPISPPPSPQTNLGGEVPEVLANLARGSMRCVLPGVAHRVGLFHTLSTDLAKSWRQSTIPIPVAKTDAGGQSSQQAEQFRDCGVRVSFRLGLG